MPCVDYIKGAIKNVNGMLEKDKVDMNLLEMDTDHTHHLTDLKWVFQNYHPTP